jgi:ketosteroid isomerase-like protein
MEMSTNDTAEVLRRFNQAFADNDPKALEALVAPDCVMESIQPAPNGTRYEGYEVNLKFWQAMMADRVNYFEPEDSVVIGDRAITRWRYHFGNGESLRGVSLVRVENGRIAEALAYAKVPGNLAPLPE